MAEVTVGTIKNALAKYTTSVGDARWAGKGEVPSEQSVARMVEAAVETSGGVRFATNDEINRYLFPGE